MDLYDVAVARKLSSGGGGGGGSSDFSTAEVTLNMTLPLGVTAEDIGLSDVDLGLYTARKIGATNNKVSVIIQSGRSTYAYGVYATSSDFEEYVLDTSSPITTTGGVVWDADEECFEINADGTITASLIIDSGGGGGLL